MGVAFARMGATIALAVVVGNPNNWRSPSKGAPFGRRIPVQRVQNPAKSKERAIVVQGEPGGNQVRLMRFRILIFAEAGGWDDAAILALEPAATDASADLRGSGCW
jgi:hypothetical protein